MAEGGTSGPSAGAAAEEANRSFDGFEEEDEQNESMEITSEGGRRRIFSKVLINIVWF